MSDFQQHMTGGISRRLDYHIVFNRRAAWTHVFENFVAESRLVAVQKRLSDELLAALHTPVRVADIHIEYSKHWTASPRCPKPDCAFSHELALWLESESLLNDDQLILVKNKLTTILSDEIYAMTGWMYSVHSLNPIERT